MDNTMLHKTYLLTMQATLRSPDSEVLVVVDVVAVAVVEAMSNASVIK